MTNIIDNIFGRTTIIVDIRIYRSERKMNWNELLKKMKKAGYVYLRDAKGSHEYWHHPERPGSEEIIAKHGAKEIGTGLANKILKRAGLK